MFCDKCEEIVNLDILLTTLVKRPEREPETPKQPRPHQENFAALVTSADAGCVICSLVRGQVLPKDRPVYNAIAVPTGQITFSLHHRSDVVIFDTDDHNKSSGDWGMGFCNIRLRSIEGDPITNLMPGLFTSRPVADDSGSEACFKMAKFWLKTCLETHDDLCQVKRSLPLPTRVLDVGIPESPSATLHISNGEYGEWVTLSHCWGKFHPATTTAENLSSQCNGILVSTLPKTFQDAITITRKLGYRYLWIDSLCIIQDSILDWERESVKMNTVYANAVLNISADAAADSSEGIFESSNRKIDGKAPFFTPPRQDYTRIPVHSPKSGLKSTLYASLWHGNEFADNDHIGGRGWVLQEAVLSHRRLRYTSSGIAWSCARVPSFCDETRPHEIHDLTEQDSYITSVYQIPRQPLPPRYIYEPKDAGRRYQVIQWWYRRINDYVNRQLTFSLDKFPAFSGIAEAYCDRTQYHYKAGIMIEDFRRGLLWQPCGRPIDLEVGPSWSWAIVGYSRKKAYETDGEVYDCTYAHFTYVDDADEVELVDISVENLGDNPFGQVVSGGRLILRGLCHELKEILQTMDFYYLSGWHRYGRFWDQNYQKVWWEQTFLPPKALRLQLDLIHASNSRIPQREDIHLLRIGMFSSDPILDPETSPCVCGESTSYLIIQEIPGLEASYRRIGIASIVGDGVKSQDWKMKTVTIL